MIKIVSMDLSVHPDSNDVKISHKIFELGFHSSSQEFKLNICQILMRSYYDRKKLLKFMKILCCGKCPSFNECPLK